MIAKADMRDELRKIEKKKTWELVDESIKIPIDVKWVYKMKQRSNCEISKHKARLVARGFVQKPGIDFDEVLHLWQGRKSSKLLCRQ